MKKYNQNFNTNESLNIPTDIIRNILKKNYYQKSIQKIDNSDVNINHLENIFTDESYYLAMKIVPLIERKILYLSYIENCRIDDICRKLKLDKKEVIQLRTKGINHFKINLGVVYKLKGLNGF